MNLSKRNTALDIVRIVAMFSVVAIHFPLHTGYYNEVMLGMSMLLFTVLRTAFSYCVPLFIMLSGYLLNKKTLSKQYYSGITKTLGIYVLASVFCMIFKRFFFGDSLSFQGILFSILDFSGANYAWYIEMYIGLFLLIPFLNLMYHGLDGKRQKIVLIVTLICLSNLPTVLNIFNFTEPGWFKAPTSSRRYQPLVMDWWVNIYPITYYMLGAYLKEYPIKLKKRYSFVLLAITALCFGIFNYYRDCGSYFSWGSYTDWYGMQALILAVLMFLFLSKIDTSKFPVTLKKVLAHISDLCLGGYLISYIADNVIYAYLRPLVPAMNQRVLLYIPTVLLIGTISLLLSQILNWIYKGFEMTIKKIFSLKQTKKTQEIM